MLHQEAPKIPVRRENTGKSPRIRSGTATRSRPKACNVAFKRVQFPNPRTGILLQRSVCPRATSGIPVGRPTAPQARTHTGAKSAPNKSCSSALPWWSESSPGGRTLACSPWLQLLRHRPGLEIELEDPHRPVRVPLDELGQAVDLVVVPRLRKAEQFVGERVEPGRILAKDDLPALEAR